MTIFNGWENFYVIVGSSAGALIGLQFVVLTLIAGMPKAQGSAEAGSAFATPSVVHFGVVLFLSAIVTAPWNGTSIVAVLLGVAGVSGIAYALIVTRRLRTQTAYMPVFEDWLFHAVFPCAAYLMLALSAALGYVELQAAPFLVGAAALVLLFVGIHNAWDAVTYHVFVAARREQKADRMYGNPSAPGK
jgi:hypothetical protein